jgi:hypothetical protein
MSTEVSVLTSSVFIRWGFSSTEGALVDQESGEKLPVDMASVEHLQQQRRAATAARATSPAHAEKSPEQRPVEHLQQQRRAATAARETSPAHAEKIPEQRPVAQPVGVSPSAGETSFAHMQPQLSSAGDKSVLHGHSTSAPNLLAGGKGSNKINKAEWYGCAPTPIAGAHHIRRVEVWPDGFLKPYVANLPVRNRIQSIQEAVTEFVTVAVADLRASGTRPRNRRERFLLTLPLLATGFAGLRNKAGR